VVDGAAGTTGAAAGVDAPVGAGAVAGVSVDGDGASAAGADDAGGVEAGTWGAGVASWARATVSGCVTDERASTATATTRTTRRDT
jgi:hypothetical protein